MVWWRSRSALNINIWLVLLYEFTFSGDVKPKQEKYLPDYEVYHNLSRIESHLKEIVSHNPNYMHIDWMYQSRNGRPQMLVRVTNFTDSRPYAYTEEMTVPKVRVLLSYGEHAREFFPVETLFNLISNVTNGLKTNPVDEFSRLVLSNLDLFIVTMVNPDGRHYVEEMKNYCWRGTSMGVDVNRNFDWQFGSQGSSSNRNDEEYRGEEPFSEPECHVLRDLTAKYKFDAFISFHSGIRQIYVPYADTVSKSLHRKPDNLQAMLDLADQMSHATPKLFTYGLAYQLNEYTADGTIFDYMAGVRKIPFSFAIELWGEGDNADAKCFDLFNPMSPDLQMALQEVHPLYETLFSYLIQWKLRQVAVMYDPTKDAPSLTFGFALLLCVVILTLFVALHSRLPPYLRLYPRRRIVSLRSLSSTFSVMSFGRLL